MICQACGHQNVLAGSYCARCGTQLAAPPQQGPSVRLAKTPAAAPQQTPSGGPQAATPPPPPGPRRSASRSTWIVIAAVLIVLAGSGAVALAELHRHPAHVITGVGQPGRFPSNGSALTASTDAGHPPTDVTPAPASSSAATPPTDVPSVPSGSDPVPVGASPPGAPAVAGVIPYIDAADTPSSAAQMVETQPADLPGGQSAALQAVTGFLLDVNAQDFPSAWALSTASLHAAAPSHAFVHGYATTRHYQVAFGQPETLASDLIAIPARFVSRQDPAAEGNPGGVTGCTYWPQYVFLVVNANGRWLDDVAGDAQSRPEVMPLKRPDSSRGGVRYLLPLPQRVAC